MILSAHAESIILLTPPAESMILSVPPERQWATPAAQWAVGRDAIVLGDGTEVARWTAQYHGSVGQSNFLYFRLVFFLLSKLPPAPDFRYSFGFS
jgi:hypothetical protein